MRPRIPLRRVSVGVALSVLLFISRPHYGAGQQPAWQDSRTIDHGIRAELVLYAAGSGRWRLDVVGTSSSGGCRIPFQVVVDGPGTWQAPQQSCGPVRVNASYTISNLQRTNESISFTFTVQGSAENPQLADVANGISNFLGGGDVDTSLGSVAPTSWSISGVDAEAVRRREQAELERQRQAELERQRQAELERQRQAELERQRQAELERQHQAELERQRQAELDRQRPSVASASGGAVRSLASSIPASVVFVNGTPGPVEVLWVNYEGGEELFIDNLAPGSEVTMNTFATHPWRFRQDGRVLAEYVVTEQPEQRFEISPRLAPSVADIVEATGGGPNEPEGVRQADLVRRLRGDLNNDELWGDLGDSFERSGDLQLARSAWAVALILDPGDSEWLGHDPSLPDAVAIIRSLEIGDDEWIGDLGDLAQGSGRTTGAQTAQELYGVALSIDPDDGEWLQKFSAPDPVSACRNLVQGRIAWDYQGSTNWATGNLEALCFGTSVPNEPPLCFSSVVHGGVNWGGGTQWEWQNALDLCAGTNNASSTVACFRDQVARNVGWPDAIRFCSRG